MKKAAAQHEKNAQSMGQRAALAAALLAILIGALPMRARADLPAPLAQLNRQLHRLAAQFDAPKAIDVLDLSTGYSVGINAAASMPAASTIKIPVMVEVFAALSSGRFDLQRRVTLLARDKDYGSGELCDAPVGSTYTISELLEKMITISDNTATNMLIRIVGLHSINSEMDELGLKHTRLTEDVRTEGWSIREHLRTSPEDLVRLLAMMARRQLIDDWSSNEMISILEGNQFNTLLPAPLPDDVAIAHKTGSLFDTLNDAGIVFASDAPYVIAVMTTALPSLDEGRSFIHEISKLTYTDELSLARWRGADGRRANEFEPISGPLSPDVRYWNSGAANDINGGV